MNIKFSPPDITDAEVNAVTEALKSGWITTGPKTKLYEEKVAAYCGKRKAVALNSATAGLELVLRILGVGEGDEVITCNYTYTASASVINHVGAKIVLADCAKNSYFIDFQSLKNAITSRTKAIIAVDIGGRICDYSSIFSAVLEKQSLFSPHSPLQEHLKRIAVIADAAHSFGAEKDGKRSGNFADFTVFSTHAVKNLTTAEGGAVVWSDAFDDAEIYEAFMLYSLHGQNKDALSKTKLGSWEYDIKLLGYKCNMTDVLASIGLAQLQRYDEMLKRRKRITEMYGEILSKTVELFRHENSSCHLMLTRVPGCDEGRRNRIIEYMASNGVAVNVHYKPLAMHSAYKALGFDIKNYPNSYEQYKNEITLPLHTLLSDEEIRYIAGTYIRACRSVK